MKFYEALRKMDKNAKFCNCDNNPDVIFCMRNNILYCCVRCSYWQPNVLINDIWFMSNKWRTIEFIDGTNGFPDAPLADLYPDANR